MAPDDVYFASGSRCPDHVRRTYIGEFAEFIELVDWRSVKIRMLSDNAVGYVDVSVLKKVDE